MTDRKTEPGLGHAARTAVVTGAGRGLGLALARCLAARGDRVIGAVRQPETAGELAGVAEVIELDVTSDASIAAALPALRSRGPIDVLINNAGIDARAVGAAPDRRDPLVTTRLELMTVMDVNVAGPMVVTQALLPQLEAAEAPVVINLSSQLGTISVGGQLCKDIAYNASKAALNMVTVRTAAELEDRGVTVVCVHPGWVQTDMGGSEAPVPVEAAARSVISIVDGLSPADTGRFFRPDGTDHPW